MHWVQNDFDQKMAAGRENVWRPRGLLHSDLSCYSIVIVSTLVFAAATTFGTMGLMHSHGVSMPSHLSSALNSMSTPHSWGAWLIGGLGTVGLCALAIEGYKTRKKKQDKAKEQQKKSNDRSWEKRTNGSQRRQLILEKETQQVTQQSQKPGRLDSKKGCYSVVLAASLVFAAAVAFGVMGLMHAHGVTMPAHLSSLLSTASTSHSWGFWLIGGLGAAGFCALAIEGYRTRKARHNATEQVFY